MDYQTQFVIIRELCFTSIWKWALTRNIMNLPQKRRLLVSVWGDRSGSEWHMSSVQHGHRDTEQQLGGSARPGNTLLLSSPCSHISYRSENIRVIRGWYTLSMEYQRQFTGQWQRRIIYCLSLSSRSPSLINYPVMILGVILNIETCRSVTLM